MGWFVPTGSQNLAPLSRVTQSLAGRTALVELLAVNRTSRAMVSM